MVKITEATSENILSSNFTTDYQHVFYNDETKKFKASLSIECTNDKNWEAFKEICDEIDITNGFKMNKDKSKMYIKFSIDKNMKIFDIEKRELNIKDISEILKDKDAKLLFTVSEYKMNGKSGISFKARQIQVKPRENKYQNCLFD